LLNGVVIIGYDAWNIQNGTVEIQNPRTVLYLCEETNVVGELMNIEPSEADAKGDYVNTFIPLQFRPIWFTRVTAGVPAKIIGLQTTTPEEYGGRNVKMLISLFSDGRMGISG